MLRRGQITPLVLALALFGAACSGDDEPTGPSIPDAPAQPVLTGVTVSGNTLVVSWNAVTGADSYDVQRQEAVSGATFATIASNLTGTSHTDNTVTVGRTYNYRVIAKNAGGSSLASDPVSGQVPAPQAPAAPTISSVAAADNALVVTWGAVSGATAYDVERQPEGGSFAKVAGDLTTTSYEDKTVTAGVTYNYRVYAKSAAGTSAASGTASGKVGLKQQVLSGTISGTRKLSADTTYVITGIVVVADGATLDIPAGTLLVGSSSVQPSAVIVRQGGKLLSVGTAEKPVVFTSDKPAGERKRGDWGGVVLNGKSLCNFPAGECVGEGASGPYGGNVLDDNSGKLVYTRIEFAGFEVSFGNELNALTLNGVGSGTEIHHVQTHYGSDDGFEWFGGTVNAKYLLATGISDDSFDYSTGWQGKGQFWILQHDPDDADTGWEVDGNEENYDATPFTDPVIYNVTLVGKGPNGEGGTAGESTRGMLQRRGTAGKVFNAIIMGFGTSGFDIDNSQTVGRFEIHNSIIFGNKVDFDTDSDGIDEKAIWETAGWANRNVDPGLVAPYNRDTPDFRPSVGNSAALGGFATPPADGFFESVNFIGGVSPTGTPWYAGWTTTARN